MGPNYYSAVLLDNIVSSLSLIQNGVDYALSLKEHSAGADLSQYNLELGFGFSSVKSNNPNNLLKILTIGKGLSKTTLGLSYLPLTNNEIGFSLQEIINVSNIYNQCYMFGAIMLAINGSNVVLTTTLATPSSSLSIPFVITKDISIEEALNMVELSSNLSFTTGYSIELELFRFVLDIDYYDGDLKTARAGMYLSDNRKTRGVLPFADEDLSFSFISLLNQNYINNQRIYDKAKSNIKLIVNDWVNLSSWDPSFVGYWTTPGNVLPTNLRIFLQNELGIIV